MGAAPIGISRVTAVGFMHGIDQEEADRVDAECINARGGESTR